MDRIIINVIDKKTSFRKRLVIEIKAQLLHSDFITIGQDVMFDKDTDHISFGLDVTTGIRQMLIVSGEGHGMTGDELIANIRASLADKFEVLSEDEVQVWLREK